MSWQDVRGHYQERDDEPARPSIPEHPRVGQRFMMQGSYGDWDVYDWQPGVCRRCEGGGTGAVAGEPPCPDCNGTGVGDYREPDRIASGLLEADARLLTFGAELLAAAERSLREHCTRQDELRPDEVIPRLKAVLRNIRGN